MDYFDTERLRIRQLRETDQQFVFELYTSEDFVRFIGDRGIRQLADCQQFIEDKRQLYQQGIHGVFVIETIAGSTPVGVISFFKRTWLAVDDIGYALLPNFTGCGYAFEATLGFIEYLRTQHNITQIAAIVAMQNQASIKLLNKLGLIFDKEVIDPQTEERVQYFLTADC